MSLLLVGGNGSIKIVILVKWTRLLNSQVSGTVEVLTRDRNRMPVLQRGMFKIYNSISHAYYLLCSADMPDEDYDPDLGFDLVSSLTALEWEGSDDEQGQLCG
jgi:hypothetical protein